MAALSADKIRDDKPSGKQYREVAIKTSATLFVGSIAAFTTAGRVQASAAATGLRPAGVIEAILNDTGAVLSTGTGNTAGTVKARVAWGHQVLVDIRTAARTYANLGKNVFALTDNEVTDTTAAGTALVRVKIGSLTEFTNSSKSEGWLALRVYGDADAV
jgi:hypothetical protein